MNSYREEPSLEPFPSTPPPDDRPQPSSARPPGWRLLRVRFRGARVYRVTPSTGGETYWHAEMTLNGEVQSRRCASELYALWWIAASKESSSAPQFLIMPELDEPLCSRQS